LIFPAKRPVSHLSGRSTSWFGLIMEQVCIRPGPQPLPSPPGLLGNLVLDLKSAELVFRLFDQGLYGGRFHVQFRTHALDFLLLGQYRLLTLPGFQFFAILLLDARHAGKHTARSGIDVSELYACLGDRELSVLIGVLRTSGFEDHQGPVHLPADLYIIKKDQCIDKGGKTDSIKFMGLLKAGDLIGKKSGYAFLAAEIE
jgi:hypothetical protein